MSCEYCLGIGGRHNARCPNSLEEKAKHYCSICGEGILNGEEYVENDDGEFVHYDCPTTIEMVRFLGYTVRTMESEDDGY